VTQDLIKEEKLAMVPQLERSASYLWMILTCPGRIDMGLNLQLNYSGNLWITMAGSIGNHSIL
jgi:hypothetical protein